MKLPKIGFCLFLFFLLFASSSLAASPGVVINEVAFKESNDWVEFYVTTAGNYKSLRIYKGTVLKKEFPAITASVGDYIVLHFGGDPASDENDTTGKESNGYWDIYTSLSGLTGTDDIIRIQEAETVSVSATNTIDAVIWSDNNGSFSGSGAIADELVTANHWDVGATFSTNDSDAWTDSDDIDAGKSIGRDALSVDTNSKTDWSIFSSFTPGSVNTIPPTPIPTPTSTPTPTPTLTPTPTFTPTPTPTPSASGGPAISFSPPAEVQVDQEFSLTVNLSSADANSSYYLKALIGETSDTANMREGKTKSEDGESWLAWNASWSKMPILQTNADGAGERTIEVKTDDDIIADSYFLVVRIRKTDATTNFDSETKTLNVTAPESEESANAENAEEPAEDTEEIPSIPSDTPAPSSPIFIAEAREMEDGEIIIIEGVVTVEPELLGSRTMYVEDESGGIKILLDEKNRDDIKLSDLVQITGALGESFNERYIKISSASDVKILGQGELPKASFIETSEINEDYEGELVLVNGKVTETSGAVFYLDDDSGQIKVYIKSSTGIEKPKMRVGYYSEVRGICSQYNDDYRILPRYQDDILVSQNPIEKGSVLGAVTILPETGFHFGDFGLLSLGIGLILRRLLE